LKDACRVFAQLFYEAKLLRYSAEAGKLIFVFILDLFAEFA